MISKAPDVETYIEEVPAARRPALQKLRTLCRRHLAGYQECMEYGMPVYKRNGVMEISFANQRQFIAVYVLKQDVLDQFRDTLGASSIGKGCVRFAKPEQIDYAVLEQVFRKTVESTSGPC